MPSSQKYSSTTGFLSLEYGLARLHRPGAPAGDDQDTMISITMEMRMKARLLALILMATPLSGAGTLALAQGAMTPDVRSTCMEDYRRFCFGTMPGGGRIIACLSEHQTELVPACAMAVAVGSQCIEDYRQFCSAAKSGNDLRHCMQQNLAKLSEPCAKVISSNAPG